MSQCMLCLSSIEPNIIFHCITFLFHFKIILVTAVSGFSKPGSSYNIDNILRGQIGDDAYFIARHVDEWSRSDFDVSSTWPGPQVPETEPDVARETKPQRNADVIGVADGVGGWRAYGVDPGLFSNNLMRNCERLVKAGIFVSNQPKALLEQVWIKQSLFASTIV